MGNLWIFGDSFSATNFRNNAETWRVKYAKWKGYTTKVWPEFLNETLQLKLINTSLSGGDNYSIFDTIIDNIDNIKENDIIIVGWTTTLRFRVINKTNTFSSIRPSLNIKKSTLDNTLEYTDISLNTINEILINRDSYLYEEELNRYIKLINLYLKNNKILHWSHFQNDHPLLNLTRIDKLDQIEKISEETNGDVMDYHYSENGHKELSKLIYNKLYE